MTGANGSTSFVDKSKNALTVTPYGNAQISTAQNPFGSGSSGYFPVNTNSPLVIDNSQGLIFGTSDFTIDGFFLPSSPPLGLGALFIKGLNTSNGLSLGLTPQGIFLRCNVYDTYDVNVATISSYSFVAWQRKQGIITFWLNGVSVFSQNVSFNHTDSDVLYVGSNTNNSSIGNPSYSYAGYISNLRITKGIARYTSNFTPPTRPFPTR